MDTQNKTQREIKFRAWDKQNKRMFEVDGLSFRNQYVTDEAGQHTFKFNQCDLIQYTGLKDKNGKDIYEGDILSLGEAKRIVVWDKPLGRWIVEKRNGSRKRSLSKYSTDKWHNSEVIGNICETPELLGSKKMVRAFCPNCEEYTEATLGVEKEVYNVRGEAIEIEAEIATCQEGNYKITKRDCIKEKKMSDLQDLLTRNGTRRMERFWVCHVEGTNGGKHHRHWTLPSAQGESLRLARLTGKVVYIFECIGKCQVPVMWEVPR